ncbi:MAG: C4-dicarboxylate TRAP transporter substrate-binding protein [Treponema sp.]|jgi:TRAP-type C4-dicarboxylate transport system substrate-binding protein|nr:C4-dicarboxylate TRAP transporter substrate-binding protein [Treponema sp.]
MKLVKAALFLALCLIIAGTGLYAGGGSQPKTDGGKVVVRFGNTQGEGDTQTMALREVAKRLNDSGRFQVEVFPSSSLGDTDDMTEQAKQGAAIVTVSDPSRLAAFVKDYGIINMPYVFKDSTVLDKIMATDTHRQWEAAFEQQNIKLITSNWYSGPRHFVTNVEVNKPADLRGQRIRTMGNDICIESVTAMGAVAVGMPWSEVYPAIQQKALDGAEVQTTSSYPTRLYELLKYTNKTAHFQLVGSVVTGTKFFNSMSKENQDLFVKTFRDVGTEYQQKVNEVSEQYEKEMASKHGMIVRDVDPAPFIEAVQPVYQKLGYADLRTKILKELGQ